jgi:hypothetical protein
MGHQRARRVRRRSTTTLVSDQVRTVNGVPLKRIAPAGAPKYPDRVSVWLAVSGSTAVMMGMIDGTFVPGLA